TVIFEAGGGDSTENWKNGTNGKETTLDCIEKVASTFTYDRPGLGHSTPNYSLTIKDPITVEKVDNDLLKVLQQRNIPKPYIIVSHSQGGLYAQYLLRKYPQHFVGAVFIDVLGIENHSVPDNQKDEVNKYLEEAKTHDAKYMYDVYSVKLAKEYNNVTEKHIAADTAYVVPGLDIDIQQIMSSAKMPNIPIIVLYSTYMVETMPNWVNGQKATANQSTNNEIIEVLGGHYIHQEKPELVCHYIKKVINDVVSKQN
ncbi:MAG: putative alpha/beta hydrolase family protein, partial [Gammaproteobacteria bacterium]|nr:putative alpha/beta hydrolase family protein [Gammaproteobacteria bacterium]